MRDVLLRSNSLWANRCSHFTSSFLDTSCSSLDHSCRPWRFSSSRTQSFWGLWAGFSKVPIGRTTGGILLARTTLPTITLAGIINGWALRFLKQIGTLGELGCNSLYMVVSITEVANWEPCAGLVSTWTHVHCPKMSVLPWMLMVLNGGMVTFCVIWKCPWMSSRQNSLGAGGLGPQRE